MFALANFVGEENKWKSGLITVQTQYSHYFLKAHVMMCIILDIFSECGITVKDVQDEGYYYKKRKIKLLMKRLNEYDAFVSETARKYGVDSSVARRFIKKNIEVEDDD